MATERTTERQQTMSAPTGGTATQQEPITGPAKGTPAQIQDRLTDLIAGCKAAGNTSLMSDAVWIANNFTNQTGIYYTAEGLPKEVHQGRRRADEPTNATGLNLAEVKAHATTLTEHIQQLRRGKLTGDAATRVLDAIETDGDWFATAFGT